MDELVKITKGDQEALVLPESVEVWESKGWKVEKPKAKGKSDSTTE